jgi:hypothetical protein
LLAEWDEKLGALREFAEGKASAARAGLEKILVREFIVRESHLQ